MKRNILCLMPLLVMLSWLQVNVTCAGQWITVGQFGNNPGNLDMKLYKPETKGNGPMPMLVAMHGCSQDALGLDDLCNLNKYADNYGFLVLYPQQKIINNPNQCFTWFLANQYECNKGENGSIQSMILFAIRNYIIDTNRIYLFGLSAGAAMAIAYAATHVNQLAGVACFAGAAYGLADNPLEALAAMAGKRKTFKPLSGLAVTHPFHLVSPRPLLVIFQGSEDVVVHPDNAKLIVDQWAEFFNTDTVPDRIQHPFNGNQEVRRSEYHAVNQMPVIISYTFSKLGHMVPIASEDSSNNKTKIRLFGKNIGFNAPLQALMDMGLVR